MVMTSRPPPRTNKTRSSPSMSTSRNSISCAQSLKERHSTQHDDAQARAFLRVGKILYENICRVYHKMCVLEADTKCTNLTTRTLTLAETVQWRETRMMSAYRKLQAQMMRSVQLYVITTAAHPHFHAVSQKSSTRRRLVETDSPIHLEAAPDKLNMIFQHWFKSSGAVKHHIKNCLVSVHVDPWCALSPPTVLGWNSIIYTSMKK